MRTFTLLIILAVLLLMGCGGSAGSSDPATMLAEIDNGSGVSESQVDPYKAAVGELESICSQPGSEIADMTAAGREFAEEEGVAPSNLQILQGSEGMANATIRNTGASGTDSCETIIAAWLTADIARGG